MQDFNDKVALITGGSSGVGRSLAFALGRLGAKVVVGDVDRAAMDRIRSDLAADNIECLVEHCDVTSRDSLNACTSSVLMAPVASTPVSAEISCSILDIRSSSLSR